MRSLGLAVAVFFVASAFVLGPAAGPAFGCDEVGVFWTQTDSSGQKIANASGAINQISLKKHTLACVGSGVFAEAGEGQTARILLGGRTGWYVELGFWEKNWSDCAIGHCFDVMMESSMNFVVQRQEYTTYHPSCIQPATSSTVLWPSFEVVNGPSNGQPYQSFMYGNWQCPNSSWQLFDVFDGFGYTSGYPDGEGWRRDVSCGSNCNNSYMGAQHTNLQWIDSSGVPHSPSGEVCRRDTDPNWDGAQVLSNEFDVNHTNSGSFC